MSTRMFLSVRIPVCWFLLALWPGSALAVDPPPVLTLKRVGDQVSVRVKPGVGGDGWVLQDSFGGKHWRDLVELRSLPLTESLSGAPTDKRLFRAAKKPMATRQEALTRARERWAATGLTRYQYRHRMNGAFFSTDDSILVENGKVKESTSMLPPEFPVFSWGEQSIEDLFNRLQQAIDGDAHAMNVRYHPEMGYPETAYVDYDEWIADEEWGFSNFGVPVDPQVLRAASELQWQHARVAAYEFDLRYETARYYWTGRVRVANGAATVIAGGDPLPGHIIMTMDQYFAYMEAALSADKVTSVQFDPALGYPLFFSRDWYLTFADGPGERFWFSGFGKQAGP